MGDKANDIIFDKIETIFAKKDNNKINCLRKSPRVLLNRIAVCTKWQSSHIIGDFILFFLKGNRIDGNVYVENRETLLDLRRKVNYINVIR